MIAGTVFYVLRRGDNDKSACKELNDLAAARVLVALVRFALFLLFFRRPSNNDPE